MLSQHATIQLLNGEGGAVAVAFKNLGFRFLKTKNPNVVILGLFLKKQ